MNVRDVVEITLALNGGRKFEKTCDQLIEGGEITEWTLTAYVRDAAALGFNKAMIVVGHERSEEPGMKALVNRLQPLLKNIPVYSSDAGEPFIYL